jgi:hypothetical protein
MTKDDGLILLKNVIKKEVYHQDYEHVTELADKYYKMKTGDEITDLLEKIVTRETEEEFEQRENISKSVIPSILNSTQLPFQKAIRKQPLLKELIYKGADKKLELEEYIGKYWGEKSLDEYLEYAIIDYNYIDPNAFLITEFEEFDSDTEKASPYPFIATSKEAVMFEFKNENLQYLIVKLPIKYIENENEKDGFKFTMYLGTDTLQLTQVGVDYIVIGGEKVKIKENYYLYQEFTPKAKKVPAQRFGYIRDAETKGRTFVSVFHPVILLLEKLMKTDSELDLSTAMTAFPQRFAYADQCSNKDCYGGKLVDGHTICSNCHGTGQQPLHAGVKDVITLTLPRNPADMIDLEKMLVYKMPPVELLTFNKDYINDLRILIHTMMFNNEIATRSEVATAVTATEMNFGTDNMNDTLYPFARNYSSLWAFVVKDIATFTDIGENLTVNHKFPTDFKMKGLTILMTELKTAKDAGASTSTITAIEDDINEILYSDRPLEKKKIEIKSLVNPFRGYNEGTVRLIISQGLTTEANAVLYSNLESIFNDLELEIPNLYDMNIKVIKDKVTVKTQEYIKQMKAEIPEEVQPPFNNQ